MAKISAIQRSVLHQVVGAGARGLVESEEQVCDRRFQSTATALIKRGLLTATERKEGRHKLLPTAEARSLLQLAGSEPQASHGVPALEELTITARAVSEIGTTDPRGKLGMIVAMLRRPDGASIADLQARTGWQAHSVRGVIAGAIKKKLGLTVTSAAAAQGRVYRIVEEQAA